MAATATNASRDHGGSTAAASPRRGLPQHDQRRRRPPVRLPCPRVDDGGSTANPPWAGAVPSGRCATTTPAAKPGTSCRAAAGRLPLRRREHGGVGGAGVPSSQQRPAGTDSSVSASRECGGRGRWSPRRTVPATEATSTLLPPPCPHRPPTSGVGTPSRPATPQLQDGTPTPVLTPASRPIVLSGSGRSPRSVAGSAAHPSPFRVADDEGLGPGARCESADLTL